MAFKVSDMNERPVNVPVLKAGVYHYLSSIYWLLDNMQFLLWPRLSAACNILNQQLNVCCILLHAATHVCSEA